MVSYPFTHIRTMQRMWKEQCVHNVAKEKQIVTALLNVMLNAKAKVLFREFVSAGVPILVVFASSTAN